MVDPLVLVQTLVLVLVLVLALALVLVLLPAWVSDHHEKKDAVWDAEVGSAR